MVDSHQEPDIQDEAGESSGGPSIVGMPRWVKVAGLGALVVVLLVVVMLLATGHHGPGRHFGGQAPLATAPAGPATGDIG